jgi:hypothetical protein
LLVDRDGFLNARMGQRWANGHSQQETTTSPFVREMGKASTQQPLVNNINNKRKSLSVIIHSLDELALSL